MSNINCLEKWLSGYEYDRFNPRSAIINLLPPKSRDTGGVRGEQISEISAKVYPNIDGDLQAVVQFEYLLNPPEELERLANEDEKFLEALRIGGFTQQIKIVPDKTIELLLTPEKSAVSLKFICKHDSGKLTIVLANLKDTSADVENDNEEEISTSERVTRWRITRWLSTVFSIKIKIFNRTGFQSMPDKAAKLSYMAFQGTKCKTINTSFRENSENEIEINSMPLFIESRFEPWGSDEKFLNFDSLSIGCTTKSIISNLIQLMGAVKTKSETVARVHEQRAGSNPLFVDELTLNNKSITDETELALEGIRILSDDNDAMTAFMFLNSAMSKKNKKFRNWRPFQLIFLVVCIARYFRSSRNEPIVLNFPTGMGKTEAFLGYALWISVYQRLRNENFGTTAVIKYPRVMLSKQQSKRALELLSAANYCLINNNVPGLRKTPFSVGVLYAKANTPNRIFSIRNRDDTIDFSPEFKELARRVNQGKKIGFSIEKCPLCGEPHISTEPRESSARIIFSCRNPACAYNNKLFNQESIYAREDGEIPVYISDDEVFRYLPTIILTTAYKFASFCTTGRWKTLIGKKSGIDTKFGHYYYASDKNDLPIKFRKTFFSNIELNILPFTPPSLIVFDEAHLVSGAQASLLGPVETAFLDIFKDTLKRYPQVISSSATLSKAIVNTNERQYQHHIAQLFGCSIGSVLLFPSLLDVYKDDTTTPQRKIVGIYPSVLTKRFAMEKVSTFVLSKIQTETDRNYNVPIYYFGSKAEMYISRKNLEDRVAVSARINNLSRNILEFSADISSSGDDEVYSKLDELEEANEWKLVLATNTIANGIDSDRFNLMLFNGLPNSTSEYLQARSRIARRKDSLGFAIVLLSRLNPREKAFLESFYSQHLNQEFLYEENPVNKYCDGIIDDTIPRLLHMYAFWNWDSPIRKAYLNGEMISFLNSALSSDTCETTISEWLSVPNNNPLLVSRIKEKIKVVLRGYRGYLPTRRFPQFTIYDFDDESASHPKNKYLPKVSTLEVSDSVSVRLLPDEIGRLERVFGVR